MHVLTSKCNNDIRKVGPQLMNLHTRICKGNDAGVLTKLMLIFQYDILSDLYELRFDTYS